MPGAFVVFEGGEGAGKSTQCRLLADALSARGLEVVLTREPGGTAIGEAVREVLLGAGSHGMAATTEALLFAAARAEHAARLIRPGVARGAVVISDRYLDSSVAYQGAARGLGEDTIAGLSLWATQGLVPDLTVVLDVEPGVGLGRADDANRMEAEPRAFHDEVRASFLRRAAAAPDRYLVVDAGQPPEEVADTVRAAVRDVLERRRPDPGAAPYPPWGVGSAPRATGPGPEWTSAPGSGDVEPAPRSARPCPDEASAGTTGPSRQLGDLR